MTKEKIYEHAHAVQLMFRLMFAPANMSHTQMDVALGRWLRVPVVRCLWAYGLSRHAHAALKKAENAEPRKPHQMALAHVRAAMAEILRVRDRDDLATKNRALRHIHLAISGETLRAIRGEGVYGVQQGVSVLQHAVRFFKSLGMTNDAERAGAILRTWIELSEQTW